MLYEKKLEDVNLAQLTNELRGDHQEWQGEVNMLSVNVNTPEPTIELPGRGEIPFTEYAQGELAGHLKVPTAYYSRIPGELRQQTFDSLLNLSANEVQLDFTNAGVSGVHDAKKAIIRPYQIAEVALKHLPEESQVVEVLDGKDFVLDVLYGSVEDDRYTGGDLQEGDLTRGGLRYTYSVKGQGKPTVSPYLYRLACTNGMETPELSLKLTSDGNGAQEYLLALENFTESALGLIEGRIEDFYSLRESEIDGEPLQALSRLASSYGLSPLTVRRLETHLGVSRHENIFDLINIITNEANNPILESRPAQSHKLQRVGGSVVVHQHGFCNNCGSCV